MKKGRGAHSWKEKRPNRDKLLADQLRCDFGGAVEPAKELDE